jgi:hypothetical protein
MKSRLLLLLLLVALVSVAGCTALFGPKPIIVRDDAQSSFSLSQGIIYNVDAWVRNDGSDGNVIVTASLLDAEKGFTRDEASTRIYLTSGQTKKVSLTLDGEFGRDYQYSVVAHT